MAEHWDKKLTDLVVSLYKSGKNCREINIIIKNKKTQKSINHKLHRLRCKRKTVAWNQELINTVMELINQGKNYKEIGIVINKTRNAINRKLNTLGYRLGYKYKEIRRDIKYKDIDWKKIQKEYDNGAGYRGIIKLFKIDSNAINWAKRNSLLRFRNISDANKKARELGKYPSINKDYNNSLIKYRQLCKFKFNINDYPNEFDFSIVWLV